LLFYQFSLKTFIIPKLLYYIIFTIILLVFFSTKMSFISEQTLKGLKTGITNWILYTKNYEGIHQGINIAQEDILKTQYLLYNY